MKTTCSLSIKLDFDASFFNELKRFFWMPKRFVSAFNLFFLMERIMFFRTLLCADFLSFLGFLGADLSDTRIELG